jgi:ATP-dependent helicase HrpA
MLADLDARLARCALEDRAALRRRARRLGASCAPGAAPDPRWVRLERDLRRSEALFERRRATVPDTPIPSTLPIAAHADAIVAAIRQHPVVIVSGDTGSGKSTQLPKLCLRAGRGIAGQIAHTQPRRVAARGVARRLAQELGQPLGDSVGFKVRFDARVRRESHVKVLTDGMLLAELGGDRQLRAYDTVIVDEAHERSLNIDFLLGYLKRLCARRPELRVIVSSATLDEERFAAFFDAAPVLRVSGRSFPVEVRYRPPESPDTALAEQVRRAVEELRGEGPGDVLVFLSGEREIHDVAGRLRAAFGPTLEVLPLYARLPLAKQDRIFSPHGTRRVVLATNVAETSLTVPGVRFVVDAGLARIGRYSPGSAVQRLPVEPISKASARQRTGRCGREGPGVCIRLYDEADHEAFEDWTEPEIRRTDLAAVLLRMKALGVGNLDSFPFLDPPARRHVNDGLRLLRELRALDAGDRLNEIGRRLARLPLDPRVGRMLLAAGELDCVSEVLVIAAGLSAGDPRERERDQRGPLPQHLRFEDERSDFLRLLKIWDHVHEHTRGKGVGALASLCRKRRLSFPRMQEWREVHLQLAVAAREMGLHAHGRRASTARIHRALLAGLLRHAGSRRSPREYQGIRGNLFRISRGSGQHERRPRWVLAAEVVDAGSAFAHTVAGIRPEWVERAAGDLVRRSHFDAWWDPVRGEPMVHEQTSLYALTLTPRRRVRFAPVSGSGAREVFIRGALVDGRFDSGAPFLRLNHALVRRRREQEARLRRPDPDIADERLFRFYDARIPDSVCDRVSFESWWRGCRTPELAALEMERSAPWCAGPPAVSLDERYPDHLEVSGLRLALEYRFRPGEADDGVTVQLPRELLGAVNPGDMEWAVPGLQREKVVALLRLLPKAMRRRLGPAQDVATAFLESAPRGVAPAQGLAPALARYLSTRHGVQVGPEPWSAERLDRRLPPHLRLRYRLLDGDGEVVAQDRDLDRLRRRRSGGAGSAVAAPAPDVHRCWSFSALPESVEVARGGSRGRLYPALVVHGAGVSVESVEDPQRARELHAQGLVQLVVAQEGIDLDRLGREAPQRERLRLWEALLPVAPEGVPGTVARAQAREGDLLQDIARVAVARAVLPGDPWSVRDAAAFAALCSEGRARLVACLGEVAAEVAVVLERHHAIRLRLEDERWPPAWMSSLDDVREQLAWLVYRGFVAATPPPQRARLAVYLQGVGLRLDKLRRGGARDVDKLAGLRPLWDRFVARARAHAARGHTDPALARYRWLLEEYRISLFCQELGAAERVSRQRLDRLWAEVDA